MLDLKKFWEEFHMKFSKLMSAALISATVLSVGAPTAFAATVEGDANANGGTALPQTGQTDVGVAFGDANPLPNTGYLRLQKVPKALDFGTHSIATIGTYYADGIGAMNNNDLYPSYKDSGDGKQANLTPKFGETDAMKLTNKKGDVNGTAWVTVVDKQETRTAGPEGDKNTVNPGTWELSVQSDGLLTAGDDTKIDDATLVLNNTQYAQSANAKAVTGDTQDDGFTAATTVAPKTIADTISLALDGKADAGKVSVAKAEDLQGAGANIFGWKHETGHEDIQLMLKAVDAKTMANKRFETKLTWTLSTGVTA